MLGHQPLLAKASNPPDSRQGITGLALLEATELCDRVDFLVRQAVVARGDEKRALDGARRKKSTFVVIYVGLSATHPTLASAAAATRDPVSVGRVDREGVPRRPREPRQRVVTRTWNATSVGRASPPIPPCSRRRRSPWVRRPTRA